MPLEISNIKLWNQLTCLNIHIFFCVLEFTVSIDSFVLWRLCNLSQIYANIILVNEKITCNTRKINMYVIITYKIRKTSFPKMLIFEAN